MYMDKATYFVAAITRAYSFSTKRYYTSVGINSMLYSQLSIVLLNN